MLTCTDPSSQFRSATPSAKWCNWSVWYSRVVFASCIFYTISYLSFTIYYLKHLLLIFIKQRCKSWAVSILFRNVKVNDLQQKGEGSNPLSCSLLPPSPLQSDSVLPECSTTQKRLERPSVRPLRTGLSLVVVERAQAEPPPPLMDLCWRLQRLRSLEEEAPSSLEVEPKDRTVGYPVIPNSNAYIQDLWSILMVPCSQSKKKGLKYVKDKKKQTKTKHLRLPEC